LLRRCAVCVVAQYFPLGQALVCDDVLYPHASAFPSPQYFCLTNNGTLVKTMNFRCSWHGMLIVGIMVILSLALSACGEPERPTVSIQHAAKTGDIDQLKRHFYWGTDVNALDDEGYTALVYATNSGHEDVAKMLIDKGADVNAKNKGYWTPLHQASKDGHTEIVELLIAKGADVNAQEQKYDNTPLHNAAYNGHVDVAELLIVKGADVNAKNNYASTPLHEAAWGGARGCS
jgi:uncharacterized protein